MSIYSEGLPDDLEAPNVVIGAGDYYVAAPYQETRHLAALWVVLIVVFLVILLLGFSFYWGSGMGNLEMGDVEQPIVGPLPGPSSPVNRLAGRGPSQGVSYFSPKDGRSITSQLACSNTPQAEWSNTANQCQCKMPYWGGTCQRESYKPQYIAAGVVRDEDINLVLPQQSITPNLSYSTVEGVPSCTDLCDAMQEGLDACAGVKWDAETKTCTTFSAVRLKPNRHPTFNNNVDSNLYIRNDRLSRLFLDEAVLIYNGEVPTNWWLSGTIVGENFALVNRGVTQILTFYPLATLNETLMTGVYTRFPFTRAEFPALVAGGDTETVYVVGPGEVPIVPVGWAATPIWVMYDFYP